MPFTPYHFGLGLLLKSLAPRHLSFASFVATQVVIDIETLVNIVRQEWPLHRFFHSFIGSISAGVAVATVLWLVARRVLVSKSELAAELRRFELGLTPLIVGGVVGGATHTILDTIMHGDVVPFYPWHGTIGMHGAINVDLLHFGCVIAGMAGIAILVLRSRLTCARNRSAGTKELNP